MVGYLPLYLRGQGWSASAADGTLAVYFAVSSICVIPLSFLSDRIGSRKAILFPGLIVSLVSLTLIPLVSGSTIWVLMILTGFVMDSFMAVMVTTLLETKGIGPAYSGTAVGIVFTITQIGGVISPPLGNSLASINPELGFFFWAALSGVGLFTLFFSTETGKSRTRAPIKV
jgi:MFS family permease